MAKHINKIEALSYIRTSSLSNVGQDKDSAKRQRAAIVGYAKVAGFLIVDEFSDEGVAGSDPIESRAGFSAMLARIAGNGVRVVLVENASRFARDLVTQELGFAYLQRLGVKLIACDSPDSFVSDTPTAIMVRQILGSVSQFEKSGLVAKLKAARDRVKAEKGKCSGRKTYAERSPEMVTLAKALSKKGLTLKATAAELAAQGFVQKNGKTYSHVAIMRMLKQFEVIRKAK